MEDSSLIIDLQYLPGIAYFTYLENFKEVIIDVGERFSKQSFRNRCRINGANKVENLIIPVKNKQVKKISQIEIDYQQKWLNTHMRAIQSAYGKAPFFEFYADEIFNIYLKKVSGLSEFNRLLLTKCLELLEIEKDIKYTENVDEFLKRGFYDARGLIHPKKDLPNDTLFYPQKYFQVFGKNFVEDLSIIDLIFCEGPNARQILKKSTSSIDKFDK